MKQYRQFTPEERDKLAIWKASGESNKECARRLDRDASSIGRELKRNNWKQEHYVAIHAQGLAEERAEKVAHSKKALKSSKVYTYVTDHLRQGWSPDQIAGRLKRDYPTDATWWITAETIYRWIYDPTQHKHEVESVQWHEYLRRKQKKRKKQQGRTVHRSHIPDRVSIHTRPEIVNARREFGHWEGDTIEGRKHKDGVHTEVERMSRLIAAVKVAAITSAEAITAQQAIFRPLPALSRRSTTLDNGKETHQHAVLREELAMATYHADPYSSLQRGSNEHGNWHLRYYFPKGTDFATVTADELEEVVWEINNRPRKILDYQTAQEVFSQEIARGCTSN